MNVMKEFNGRIFPDFEDYKPFERLRAYLSQNHIWLSTVEIGSILSHGSSRTVIRIIRWRAKEDKDSGEKYWEYKSYRKLNINSIEEWEAASNLVDYFFKGNVKDNSLISISAEEYNRLYADSRKQQSKIKNLLAEIRGLKNLNSAIDAERQTFKQRLSIMKANIGDLEAILHDYKKLVSSETTNETDVKDYLENNHAYWMFGLEYIDIKREVGFPFGKGKKDFYFDFMLQRHDEFLDLVECKGPNENLFDKRTRKRNKPNEKLSEAIGQVFRYLYAIDKTWDEKVIKPKAYIVIGKQEKDVSSERRIFSSYLSNTEIITYSELYERGQQLLKHIRNIKV